MSGIAVGRVPGTAGSCVAGAAILNAKMRLTEVATDTSATRNLDFDAAGRVKQSRQTTGGQAYDLSYTWTSTGALKSETLPSARVVSYGFDDLGRVASVDWTKGTETGRSVAVDEYTAHGALKKLRFGGNLLVEQWSYSGARLQARRMTLGTAGIPERDAVLEYSYCAGQNWQAECAANNGNVREQKIQPVNETQSYSYDGLNRVTGSAAGVWSESYGMDGFGNLSRTGKRTGGTGRCRRGRASAMIMDMGTLRITEAELARDVRAVLAKVENGSEVIIEQEDHRPVAVISAPRRSGRPITEILREARQRNSTVTLDEDFGKDLEEIIAHHQQPWNPPSWD